MGMGCRVRLLAWDRDIKAPAAQCTEGVQVERVLLSSTHGRGALQILFYALLFLKILWRGRRTSFDVMALPRSGKPWPPCRSRKCAFARNAQPFGASFMNWTKGEKTLFKEYSPLLTALCWPPSRPEPVMAAAAPSKAGGR